MISGKAAPMSSLEREKSRFVGKAYSGFTDEQLRQLDQ
jgi:hypothetical protein